MSDISYNKFIKKTMVSQPVVSISGLGHVSNGKSTLVKQLSGETTQRHSDEKVKNITIKLGYANAKIYKCSKCPNPQSYQPAPSTTYEYECKHCGTICNLVSHCSFLDCPGHSLYLQNLLSGVCIMDTSILVESAANKNIPEIQTEEHFEIAHEAGIGTAFVCLNKMDLLVQNDKDKVKPIIKKISDFTQKYGDKIPIVPISATLGLNMDVVCEYIANIPIPQKDLSDNFKMLVVRSFNVNKDRTPISDLKGGVIGGSLIRGKMKLNDDVIIYPGYIKKNNRGSERRYSYTPLISKALSINSGKAELDYAISGGLIGVQLDIDPAFTGDDKLSGSVVYSNNNQNGNIKVYEEITLKYKRIAKKKDEKFNNDDKIQINVNSNNISCKIKKFDDDYVELILDNPVCLEQGDVVTISKKIRNSNIDIFAKGFFETGIESLLNV